MYGRLQVHKAKLLNPRRWANAPKDGIVAVKVQYPDALQVMIQDLSNIRVAARFLEVRGLEAPSSSKHTALALCDHLPVQQEDWKLMGCIGGARAGGTEI